MDSLTQAVLGAGIQGAMLGRYHGRKALMAGAALATLPDLDVLIRYADPVTGMINHRGFSHSIFVLSALAAVLAFVWRRWRPTPQYGYGWLFLTLWLVLVTHPVLDAFTSYGTQLWWPLRPTPTAWSSIFIIDPFFTVPLFATVVAALIVGDRPRVRPALTTALVYCVAYLALSVVAKTVIEARVHSALTRDGINVQTVFSTPEPFNIVLWRVLAKTDSGHYVETISSLLDREPPEYISLPLNAHLAQALPDSTELAGLQWFTGNWLRYDNVQGHLVVTDLRMGLGAGFYSFRFQMAKRPSAAGPWQPVTPSYWPTQRGGEELGAITRRIWQQKPPLPLGRWEQNMTRMPATLN